MWIVAICEMQAGQIVFAQSQGSNSDALDVMKYQQSLEYRRRLTSLLLPLSVRW